MAVVDDALVVARDVVPELAVVRGRAMRVFVEALDAAGMLTIPSRRAASPAPAADQPTLWEEPSCP